MNKISIENEFSKLTVLPSTGQVLQWNFLGRNIFYKGTTEKRTGIPILFPFAGKLENNIFDKTNLEIPQHGFGRLTSWECKKESDKILLKISNETIDPEFQKAYPYKFECQIELTLHLQKLIYKLSVTNLDNQDLPISPGIHPYFPIKHENKNKLQILNNKDPFKLDFDWNIPSDGYYYKFNDSVLIYFPDNKMLEISKININNDFKHLVLWSQVPPEPDINFVCIEPFCGKPNEININPILVKTNTTWFSEIEFTAL